MYKMGVVGLVNNNGKNLLELFFIFHSFLTYSYCAEIHERGNQQGEFQLESPPSLIQSGSLLLLPTGRSLLVEEKEPVGAEGVFIPVINSGSTLENTTFPQDSQTQATRPVANINTEFNGPVAPTRICRDKDTTGLNQCLHAVLEDIKPRLAEGISEVGLPGIDPLRIPHLSFEHGSGTVKIGARFADVEITGLSKFNKSDFWVDIEKQMLDFDVTFPHILLAGTYQLSGNLFFVPIAGNGHFWLNLGGVSSKGSGKLGSLLTTTTTTAAGGNGDDNSKHRRVILHKTEVDLNIDSIKVHLTNLFNGDRLLGSVINNFLNENSREIFDELKPQIGSQVGEMLTLLANRALSALPVDYFDDLPTTEGTDVPTTNVQGAPGGSP